MRLNRGGRMVDADSTPVTERDARLTSSPASPHLAPFAGPSGLTDGERRWLWLTELPYLACALAAVVWVPPQRPLNVLVCLALVGAYALASDLRVPLRGGGHAPVTQIALVPMLFFAPLNLVPLMVLAGLLLGEVAVMRRTGRSPVRSVLCLGNSWYVLGPVTVLAVAGHHEFAWSLWPVYVLALVAQVAVDVVASARARLDDAMRASLRDIVLVPVAVDVVLCVPALAVVAVAADAPVAAALALASLLALAGGFTTERSGRIAERHQATRDPLTGLPNRRLFDELADAACERARRGGEPSAVMLLDLNDFKGVNDDLGHDAGDRVLVQAGERLRAGVRAADTVARLGGDEFALLLEGRQSADACDLVAGKLRQTFCAPFDLPGGPRLVGVAVGAALIDGATPIEQALHDADLAMYADKQAQGFARGGPAVS